MSRNQIDISTDLIGVAVVKIAGYPKATNGKIASTTVRRNRCHPNQSRSPVFGPILVNTMISCDGSGGVGNRGERRCIRRRSHHRRDNPSNKQYATDAIAIGGI